MISRPITRMPTLAAIVADMAEDIIARASRFMVRYDDAGTATG